MKSLKSVLAVAGITVAAVFAFAAPAQAGGHGNGSGSGNSQHSAGNIGLLNGNQLQLPVNIGLNACGNGIAVLGLAGGSGNCGNKFH
ncbi:chaplin family protein [Actinoplanes sp. NPDC049265]|uniref:chaplin family protein n=1 Tax=Actinoplanes sp. NPDC049265 TaxID=3363902 RepID=UPI00371A5576